MGVDEPFYTYLTCYTVLAAQHDPRATRVLQTAYTLLESYAGHIYDEHLRHSFWENVAVHRMIQQAYATTISSLEATG